MSTKTISQKLREHALGRFGSMTFDVIPADDAFNAVWRLMKRNEGSVSLSPEERRMFCLFVAEMLEAQS